MPQQTEPLGRIIWTKRPKAKSEPPTPEPKPAVPPIIVPLTAGGHVCTRCGSYVVAVEIHDDYHQRFDRWARYMNGIASTVKKVFLARGWITADQTPDSTTGKP
ncbi:MULTISPECIES: hypothetical protein [Actinomycetes]|uniref:hypothetical protein n=1 Tax=Micromonospora sp. NPDC005367 TaxID=3155590 RepID=UPI0033A14437